MLTIRGLDELYLSPSPKFTVYGKEIKYVDYNTFQTIAE